MPHPGYDRKADERDSEALKERVSRMILVAKKAGMTQGEIAKPVGTTQGGVSAWERKETVPTAVYLMRLIRVCSRPGAVFNANWVLVGQGDEFVTPVRETPDEAYVRVGLTILAKVEDATAGIRSEILRAEGRLRATAPPAAAPGHGTAIVQAQQARRARRRGGDQQKSAG